MTQEIMMYILGGLGGCVIFFLKDLKSNIKESIEKNQAANEKTKKELQELKNSLPREFVYRDDFLRVVANLDTKVDRLTVDISHINENVAKLLTAGGDKV